MISVLCGAAVALTLALAWIAVPWPRVAHACSRLARRRPRARLDHVTSGFGYRIITDRRTEVSSMQVYANGTTQVWIKRRAAA